MAVTLFRLTSPVQYMTSAAFIAWAYGIDLSTAHLLVGALLAVVVSLGSVGLPGQVTFIATNLPVAQSLGLPLSPLGLMLAVDTIPDAVATLGDQALEVHVDLDVPGETGRQARVFALWFLCLGAAVTLAAMRRPYIPATKRDSPEGDAEMSAYRFDALRIALGLGVAAPGLLTWWITYRRRRGGPHPRGIAVAITPAGELRLWGRGYGQRLRLAGALVEERLVDVYTGRLGAWRQRRMRIRAKLPIPGMPSEIELATPSIDEDEGLDLPLHGGEGDCVELVRDDYLRVLRRARLAAAATEARAETEDSA